MKLSTLAALLILALLVYAASGILDGDNLPSQLWYFVVGLFGG
jgi:hypothetical protein